MVWLKLVAFENLNQNALVKVEIISLFYPFGET